MGGHLGYRVKYVFRTSKGRSSYEYQRFFRAIYGYTQVVCKSSGRRYVYRREGVLTPYPYVKEGRSCVVIPENALQALLDFFKSRKNPAHHFEYVGEWKVSYSIEETHVPTEKVISAILDALDRIYIPISGGNVPVSALIKDIERIDNATAADLVASIHGVVSSSWYRGVRHAFPWSEKLDALISEFRAL